MILILSVLLLWITWLFYLALMMIRSKKDSLTKPAKIFTYPMLLIGVVLDILLNLIVGTIVFLEIPREFLFTTRCKRHLHKTNFRGNIAMAFCKHFLNPFDKDHCGKL